MKVKLTAIQKKVIASLMDNKGSFLLKSNFYHWNKIINDHKVIMGCIHRPTFYSLKNKKIIVEFEKDKYKLNPDFKIVNSKQVLCEK
jgi:hypothetical protein